MIKIKAELKNAGFIVSAFRAWLITAPCLLLLAAAYLSFSNAGIRTAAYLSSGISFLAAFSAGCSAARASKGAKVYTAVVSATAIITVLLTLGFIVRGAELPASGVLSVVSFTYAGALSGAVFLGGRGTQKKKHKKLKLT